MCVLLTTYKEGGRVSEQIGLNYQGILDNQQKIGELESKIMDIHNSLNHILQRLHALEKKERARARDDHALEMHIERYGDE